MSQVENTKPAATNATWKRHIKNVAYIFAALVIFLFALDLMISSFQQLGKTAVETILLATSNPFTALFIGLLVTAIIQSSSATTSMVVALVASGSLSLQSAIPIIMGANIGTTITSTIVSLGFIARKKEFTRAVSAGTYHDFFNILTISILFPLEYYFGFLSSFSQWIATSFFNEPVQSAAPEFSLFSVGFTPMVRFLIDHIGSGFVLVIMSFGLLFGSILFFRKVLTDLLGLDTQNTFQKLFFKGPTKAFGWGLVATAVVRSSTITTSLVVPLVAKKIVKLRDAMPFILGANIGTTITAFLASVFTSNSAISIAIAHLVINLFGVAVFFLVPFVREMPLWLAIHAGKLTRKYRLAGFLYILVIFFLLPFSLIYLHRDQAQLTEALYEKTDFLTNKTHRYSVVIKNEDHAGESLWMFYNQATVSPSKILSVYKRKDVLLMGDDLYEFNDPGSCRDGGEKTRQYELCVVEILNQFKIAAEMYDSVYVFKSFGLQNGEIDSTSQLVYISSKMGIILKKVSYDKLGVMLEKDELIRLEIK